MTGRKSRVWILLSIMLLVIAASAQTKSQATKKKTAPPSKPAVTEHAPPALEPKAVELLKAMSDKLAAAHTLSFEALESFESPSRQGHPLIYSIKSQVTLQRPDKLRVITVGDGPSSEFYYDGKTMTAFAAKENLVAVADAPSTIDATLEAVYKLSGTYFPFTDLIVADPYKDAAPGMQLAYYIGQSQNVADTTTDMVAYVGDGIFAQIWIGTEDKLPRLIHAVYLDDPEQLRHNLFLSKWQLDPAVPADAFTNLNAANAKRISFAHPHPQTPPGARPTEKPTSRKLK